LKFFSRKANKSNFLKKSIKRGLISIISPQKLNLTSAYINIEFLEFVRFFSKDGLLVRERNLFCGIVRNLNYFFYQNCSFIYENYPNIKWILEDMVVNRLNYSHIFSIVTNLIKPPFVIKSVLIPKKLRKKIKQKYLVKIVYKNDTKRLKSSYKQLYYYSNKFTDSKFQVRLYKSLMFSFLDWKSSHLFKLKTMVFKKFFKF